jgi:hypothetical protein
MAALWQGEVHKATDYSEKPRPMRFLSIEPNPADRIVRAACHASGQ